MRYLPLFLLVFSLSFVIGHFKNRLFAVHPPTPTETPRPVSAVAPPAAPMKSTAANSATASGPLAQTAQVPEPTAAPPFSFKTAQGPALFQALFDGPFRERPFSREDLKMVEQRFETPYPPPSPGKHLSAPDRETADRIGLLKAFAENGRRHPSPATAPALKAFYEKILTRPKEPLMVKRQALRGLASIATEAGERERWKRMRGLDPALLSVSGMDDSQLIEVILGR